MPTAYPEYGKGVFSMISAIIYSSTTGSCEILAREMSRKLAIPCYSVKGLKLPKGMEVIYVGWALAGKVVGLSKIRKDYSVKAVVQVGMSPVYPSSVETCARQNDLAGVKVFVKQGRFDIDRLPLPFKLIMKVKCKEIASRLAAKGNLTEAEQATLTMAKTGKGETPCWDVEDVVDWEKANRNPLDVTKWYEPID